MQKIEKHLQQLQQFGLDYTLKETGFFLLNCQGVEFKLLKENENLFFKGRLASCPANNKAELFAHLMKGNLLAESTYGNAIGLSADGNSLTLTGWLSYEADYELFKEKLELFLGAREIWQQEIKEFVSKNG